MKSTPSVDEYIKRYPVKVQGLLQQIRKTIKAAASEAKEVISYPIPGYMYYEILIFFAHSKKPYPDYSVRRHFRPMEFYDTANKRRCIILYLSPQKI